MNQVIYLNIPLVPIIYLNTCSHNNLYFIGVYNLKLYSNFQIWGKNNGTRCIIKINSIKYKLSSKLLSSTFDSHSHITNKLKREYYNITS